MKKTILYLFFVVVLINSVFAVWYIEDSGSLLTQSLSQEPYAGMLFKPLVNNITKINGIKNNIDTANICGLFSYTNPPQTLILSNFINNNCSIEYNLTANISYIFAQKNSGGSFTLKYDVSTTPIINNEIVWEKYTTNNSENWTFYDNFQGGIYLMEIRVGYDIPSIPPANITPNITEINQTELNNIAISLNLIGNNIYIIFIGLLMCLFLYLGYKINYNLWVISGVLFWFIGLLDFNSNDIDFNISKFIFYVVIGITFIILGFVLEITRNNKQKPKGFYDNYY